jgi:uncharacterized RDD family membrane protein YckC
MRWFVFAILLLLVPSVALADLVAAADEEGYVIGQPIVEEDKAATKLIARPIGGDEAWRTIRTIPGVVKDVAVIDGNLALLLDGDTGSWLMLRARRVITAPDIGEPIADFANVGGTLHAVTADGRVLHYDGSAWDDATPAPTDAATAWQIVDLAGQSVLIGGETPFVWDGDAWQALPTPPVAGRVLAATIVEANQPRLALLAPGEPATLAVLRGEAWQTVELEGDLSEARSAVWAGGALRVLMPGPDDAIVEAVYDAAGATIRPPTPLDVSVAVRGPGTPNWLIMAAMGAVLLAALQMRPPPVAPTSTDVTPAPPLRRFGAALIDVAVSWVPVTALMSVYAPQTPSPQAAVLVALGAGFIAHMAYMLLTEVGVGRSPGKMLLGLAVVGLDNKQADRRALWTRNLMRVVDVWPAGLPLAMVLVTPLRQRLGDMTAGTVVVPSATLLIEPIDAEAAASADG